MGLPINFQGSNMRLLPPEGADNVIDMPTFTNGTCSVSCWKLSPAEVAEINATGRVFLAVLSGRTQPPVFVGDEATVRAVVADCGGAWKAPASGREAGREERR